MEDWDSLYTIEFKGTKGWEVIKSYPKTVSLNTVIQDFHRRLINNDGQYRLTTPA